MRTPPQATKVDPILKAPDRPNGAVRGKCPILHTSDEELQGALGEVNTTLSKDVIDSDI